MNSAPTAEILGAAAPGAAPRSRLGAWLGTSLARRLTLGLIVALLVSAGLLAALALAISRDALRREHEQSATRVAHLFEASLQNAMLKHDLEGMAGILAALGQSPGVMQARLLAPQGTVRFASRPEAVGTGAQAQIAGLCLHAGCASSPPRLAWHAAPEGDQLQIAYPIRNQARCAQCHGQTDERPVNGVLLVDFKPLPPATPGSGPALLLAGAGLVALALFAAIMGFTLRRQVTRPLAALAQATDRLAAGELSARVKAQGEDELGRVSHGFNRMAARIDAMVGTLNTQRQFLQTLIDAVPDPLLVIGPDHRIRLANRAYATLLGHDAQAVVGQPCHRASRGLTEPCPSTLVTCPLAEIRQHGQPVRSMLRLQRRDGTAVDVDIEAAPVHAADGEALVVEVLRPLERTLRFSQEQRLSTIGLLANGVAHEIHNPLASIRLALQAILRGLHGGDMERPEMVDYLELVDREIDRCVLTTQRLMQMSQAPTQTLQPVALAAAIDDVLALLREECRARGVQVRVGGVAAGDRVLGDEAELRQVLVNLVHNALHAMPQGGRIDIEGTTSDDGTSLRLDVRDSGCGIALADQPLIFMPFFSRRVDGERGTGLGLAICKATMERFGGAIGVHSAPGQGSTFTLTLQRLAADAATGAHA